MHNFLFIAESVNRLSIWVGLCRRDATQPGAGLVDVLTFFTKYPSLISWGSITLCCCLPPAAAAVKLFKDGVNPLQPSSLPPLPRRACLYLLLHASVSKPQAHTRRKWSLWACWGDDWSNNFLFPCVPLGWCVCALRCCAMHRAPGSLIGEVSHAQLHRNLQWKVSVKRAVWVTQQIILKEMFKHTQKGLGHFLDFYLVQYVILHSVSKLMCAVGICQCLVYFIFYHLVDGQRLQKNVSVIIGFVVLLSKLDRKSARTDTAKCGPASTAKTQRIVKLWLQ